MAIESIEALVGAIEKGFWAKWHASEKFRDALKGKDRDIHIHVVDGESWQLVVRDGQLKEAARGTPVRADVVIAGKTQDILAVANRQVHPLKAYVTGLVKVKAPLKDVLLVKAFL